MTPASRRRVGRWTSRGTPAPARCLPGPQSFRAPSTRLSPTMPRIPTIDRVSRALRLAALTLLIPAAAPLSGQDQVADAPATARAVLLDAQGDSIGSVQLTEARAGGVLLHVRASSLSPGVHAIHIHETGRCDPPDFSSAGAHYAPEGHAHGPMHADGMHAGDLVNLHAPADGTVELERLARHVTLEDGHDHALFDADGSAIVLHAGADDYRSQPSGDAGGRVACGVVER